MLFPGNLRGVGGGVDYSTIMLQNHMEYHVINSFFYSMTYETGYIADYNQSNIFARARLVKTRHVTQYAPTKIGEYPRDIPQFK